MLALSNGHAAADTEARWQYSRSGDAGGLHAARQPVRHGLSSLAAAPATSVGNRNAAQPGLFQHGCLGIVANVLGLGLFLPGIGVMVSLGLVAIPTVVRAVGRRLVRLPAPAGPVMMSPGQPLAGLELILEDEMKALVGRIAGKHPPWPMDAEGLGPEVGSSSDRRGFACWSGWIATLWWRVRRFSPSLPIRDDPNRSPMTRRRTLRFRQIYRIHRFDRGWMCCATRYGGPLPSKPGIWVVAAGEQRGTLSGFGTLATSRSRSQQSLW